MPDGVRVRFCPSPTGNPHVGLVRTALFNWAYARHTGGSFVFRIEDTDAARDSEESYLALLEAMRWLGLDWDEGPEVGGPHEPYRQSQRAEVYADVARRLREAERAYDCYCTQEEVGARHEAAGRPANLGYDGHCRALTDAQVEAFRAEGRAPSLRLRMPGRTLVWDDLVRGELAFDPEHVPDYVLVRANGQPLYTLVNPVDDALMEITHVLRGEDLLSSTPRQLALYEALAAIGVGTGETPAFGHLPYVMGEGNKKLSKRDPTSSLQVYRDEGYLPEAVLNYLALLGWSAGEEERFTLAEMVERFDVTDVQRNPARFDVKKLRALNGDHIRALPGEEFGRRLTTVLQEAGLVADPPTGEQERLVAALVPLVQTRLEVLSQAPPMLAFLFVDDAALEVDPEAAAVSLVAATVPTLQAAHGALAALSEWTVEAVEAALRAALVEGLGLKPKAAFPPLYVAVMGRRSGPPLFDSLGLLGRDSSLARLERALQEARGR